MSAPQIRLTTRFGEYQAEGILSHSSTGPGRLEVSRSSWITQWLFGNRTLNVVGSEYNELMRMMESPTRICLRKSTGDVVRFEALREVQISSREGNLIGEFTYQYINGEGRLITAAISERIENIVAFDPEGFAPLTWEARVHQYDLNGTPPTVRILRVMGEKALVTPASDFINAMESSEAALFRVFELDLRLLERWVEDPNLTRLQNSIEQNETLDRIAVRNHTLGISAFQRAVDRYATIVLERPRENLLEDWAHALRRYVNLHPTYSEMARRCPATFEKLVGTSFVRFSVN